MTCRITASALKEPQLLSQDNFTPLARTPWGGTVISRLYKNEILPNITGEKIGEAWEFSCDPQFPSRLMSTGDTLLSVVEAYPDLVLSPHATKKSCELLVKLLNAAEPLSLQVHPRDGDSNLTAQECGKPESWYVLACEPGAGLYLGFSEAVEKETLRHALLNPDPAMMQRLLQFVPVAPGDYFEIEPGVVHAIGGGVTLLEPQRIVQGMSGKTYRLWDWGRRYNAKGELDMVAGTARELHIEASLKIIDSTTQVGMPYVNTLRRTPKITSYPSGVVAKLFPKNPYYQLCVLDFQAGATITVSIAGGYGAVTCLSGDINIKNVPLLKGQSALLPFAASPLVIAAPARAAQVALLVPDSAVLGLHHVS